MDATQLEPRRLRGHSHVALVGKQPGQEGGQRALGFSLLHLPAATAGPGAPGGMDPCSCQGGSCYILMPQGKQKDVSDLWVRQFCSNCCR